MGAMNTSDVYLPDPQPSERAVRHVLFVDEELVNWEGS